MGMGEGDSSSSKCFSPSLGIAKSWQGIVELVLRIAIIVLALMMIAAGGSSQVSTSELLESALAIQGLTASAGGWLMCLGIVLIIYEIIFIVLRFLNIRVVNSHITIVLIIDAVASFVVSFLIFFGTVSMAAYIPQWGVLVQSPETSSFFRGIHQRIVTACAASAGFGFLSMIVLIGLGVFILLGGLVCKWGVTRGKVPSVSSGH